MNAEQTVSYLISKVVEKLDLGEHTEYGANWMSDDISELKTHTCNHHSIS